MVENFSVIGVSPERVVVILHPICKISREEIIKLLEAAGVDVSIVEFIEPGLIENCEELSGVPIIIPVDDENLDDKTLEQAAGFCATIGGGIIVLCGDEVDDTKLHPIARMYGTQIGWSPENMSGCLTNPKQANPKDSTGETIVRPKSNPVRC